MKVKRFTTPVSPQEEDDGGEDRPERPEKALRDPGDEPREPAAFELGEPGERLELELLVRKTGLADEVDHLTAGRQVAVIGLAAAREPYVRRPEPFG